MIRVDHAQDRASGPRGPVAGYQGGRVPGAGYNQPGFNQPYGTAPPQPGGAGYAGPPNPAYGSMYAPYGYGTTGNMGQGGAYGGGQQQYAAPQQQFGGGASQGYTQPPPPPPPQQPQQQHQQYPPPQGGYPR